MELGCLFPPTTRTPEHIALAEELGYQRALLYDSPAFLADPWITLAVSAAGTSRIRLGVAAITPRLRHVVATAGALATLYAFAPGRVEAVVGAGFTAQLMLGKKPVPWVEVERFAVALRDLLAGREIEWDGAVTGLKHGARAGVALPCDIPLHLAAHGPRGYAVAARAGDGIVTNLSHTGGNPPPDDMSQVQVLYYGTVLTPGERYDSARVVDAAGPYAAFQLHLGELGVVADTAECAAFSKELAEVDERRRHLELHRAHLTDLTDLDRPFVSGDLIARTTGTGDAGQVRERLARLAATGARGVLYGPMGEDIPRELEAFAAAAVGVRSA
jgi:5,10-methylenetetrahydromethanopterin reductase